MDKQAEAAAKKPRRRFVRAILISSVIAIAGAAVVNWGTIYAFWTMDRVVLKNVSKARWESMDATMASLSAKGGTSPKSWSAAVFLGADPLQKLASAYEGYQIENVDPSSKLHGTRIVVDKITLKPAMGFLYADIRATAFRAMELNPSLGRIEQAFGVRILSNVVFQGIEKVDQQSSSGKVGSIARFRIDPLEVEPVVSSDFGDFALRGAWVKLIPALTAALTSDNMFELPLPLQNDFSTKIGFNEFKRETLNGDTDLSVAYNMVLPTTEVSQQVTYGFPVFRPEGIWLLGRLSDEGQQSAGSTRKMPDDENLLVEQVASMTRTFETVTEDFRSSPDSIRVLMNEGLVSGVNSKLAALGPDRTRLTIKGLSSQGKLLEGSLPDYLGGASFLIEPHGFDTARATFQVSNLSARYDDSGLGATVPYALDVSTAVKIHIDPKIGGGFGTSIGLSGRSAGELKLHASPVILEGYGVKVAAVRSTLECVGITADLTTDGVLQTDFMMTNMPRIGARFTIPIGRQPLGGMEVFAGKSVLIEVQADDPRTVNNPALRMRKINQNPWAAIPRVGAIGLQILPEQVDSSGGGIEFKARLEVTPYTFRSGMDLIKLKSDFKAYDAAVEAEISGLMSRVQLSEPCDVQPKFAVLIDDTEIGENNEFVKLLSTIGKMAAQMEKEARAAIEKAAHELSEEKFKEWLNDPANAFSRSEFGTLIRLALNAPPVQIDIPEIRLPDVRLPEVRLPDVRLPEVRLPEFRF